MRRMFIVIGSTILAFIWNVLTIPIWLPKILIKGGKINA